MSKPGWRPPLVPLVWVIVLLGAPASTRAQADSLPPLDRREEARFLRDAISREAVGDYGGAERALVGLLRRKPDSPGALFALERVLRAQGRAVEVLGAVDAFLDERPGAGEAHYLKLRILAEADSMSGLVEAGRAWLQAQPALAESYREVARVFEGAFGPRRALDVLLQGRDALGDSAALALEIADLLVQTGNLESGVEEWSLALSGDAARFPAILRRVMELDESRAEVADALAERLGSKPTTVARRRAGAQLAVGAGLEERGLSLARGLVEELSPRSRRGFLSDLAGRAMASGSHRVALWAYREERKDVDHPGAAGELDEKIAHVALTLGDTASALEARDRAAGALPEGSDRRRGVLAASLRLLLSGEEAHGAGERFQAFRSEFPRAPETDELAATLASRLLAEDRAEAAEDVLEGVEGPFSALERAHIHLSRGSLPEGQAELMSAIPGLAPHRATEEIQLLALLESLQEPARGLAGRVAALGHAGRTSEALETLEEGLTHAPEQDRPGLLAMGARLAGAAGSEERAAEFRGRLIREFPDAAETPEAMLRQARWHAVAGAGPEIARELLERLIVDRPESPVVPEARRVLERLRGGTG